MSRIGSVDDLPVTIMVPPNIDSHDVWQNLFHLQVMRYAEPTDTRPLTIDAAALDRKIHEAKMQVLAEYGLHLNV